MTRYPHLKTSDDYPDVGNVNAYKYDNGFDYNLYDTAQMNITICSVPWDVGLVHVGNAQVSGLGNVVMFDSDVQRDAWFAGLADSYTWTTKYRSYHDDLTIEVPLPYQRCVNYNYVYVDYAPLPVEYTGGRSKYFYFIRECEALAPNTTKIRLMRDSWQNYIRDVNIKYMMLKRGHAPMTKASADAYLSNPLQHNDYLLADDVNFGTARNSRIHKNIVLNSGDVWAVIVTNADATGNWGVKNQTGWRTPGGDYFNDGAPSLYAFAVEPSSLAAFLSGVDDNVPQFKQTVQGVFFISKDLIAAVEQFTLGGVACWRIARKRATYDLARLTKQAFGYNAKYADLAKLYTYPYAYLEIATDSGDVVKVRIEETGGQLDLTMLPSLAWPWIALDGVVSGIGTGLDVLTFTNMERHGLDVAGGWYDYLYNWNVPCFAVTQDASVAYDYGTHFERVQQAENNVTRRDDSLASAQAAKANADNTAATNSTNSINSANTAKTNSDRSAQASYDNSTATAATVQTNANASSAQDVDNTARTNQAVIDNAADTNGTNTLNAANAATYSNQAQEQNAQTATAQAAWDNAVSWRGYAIGTETALAGLANSTVQNALGSTVSAAAQGAMAGGLAGGFAGGMAGLAGVGMSAYFGVSASLISSTASKEMTESVEACNNAKTNNSNVLARFLTKNENDFRNATTSLNNSLNTATTNRSAQASNSNAQLNKATIDANAGRTYARDVANALNTYNAAIDNATGTQSTDLTNADNVKTTANTNAKNTYDAAVGNAVRDKTTADNAIENAIRQAGLEAPKVYGKYADGQTATTRPQGLFCNVVTQAADEIAQAGDYFLRYGYAVNRQWDFKTFNEMPKFTYWEVADMWIDGNNVPDAYLDEIRFLLLGGVTVWSNPDYIGKISIYENVED